eukprot:513580-Rhodomonas_salina.1
MEREGGGEGDREREGGRREGDLVQSCARTFSLVQTLYHPYSFPRTNLVPDLPRIWPPRR